MGFTIAGFMNRLGLVGKILLSGNWFEMVCLHTDRHYMSICLASYSIAPESK